MAVTNASGDMVNWARGAIASVEAGAREELERTMQDGAELTIGYIATRGTAKSGKAGRIESKDMIRDVTHRVDDMSDGRSRGFFGWLGAWNNPDKKYYVYQEGSFKHWRSGEMIEGMYALTDAAAQAFEDAKVRMAQVLARANAPQFTKRVVIGKKGHSV